MWVPFVSATLVGAMLIVAIVLAVRRQRKWREEEAHTMPEVNRKVVESNYRIFLGMAIVTLGLLLSTIVAFIFILRDAGVW
jgi:hypothetical protein